jgi:hypothetical protein
MYTQTTLSLTFSICIGFAFDVEKADCRHYDGGSCCKYYHQKDGIW